VHVHVSRRPVKNAARLAAILDSLPDALLLVDRNGVVVNANAMALESFETPGSALVGTPLLDMLPGFDRSRLPGAVRRPQDGPPEARTRPERFVARRTDGTAFPVEITSSYLPGDYGDDLLMLVCRNLTDAVDAELELRRQQRQTELILRAASEGICGIDTNGRIVLVNPAAARILRYRANDLGGQDLHALLQHSRVDGSAYPVDAVPIIDTLRTGRKHRRRDEVLWRRDGTPIVVEMSTAPVLEGESLVGAVMTFTDQSAMNAVSRRHDELVTILERELRKPLRGAFRELTQLANGDYGHMHPEAHLVLKRILGDSSRLVRLVDDVLDYERLANGKIQLTPGLADIEHLVQFAVNSTAELASASGVGFAVHASSAEVTVDDERITQALAHLLTDVILASTPGTTVMVAAARRGNVARVEVRGPRGSSSSLHLPIARGLVEKHGGTLQAHDVPGRGNTYVVELPVRAGDALPALPAAQSSPAPVGRQSKQPPARVNGSHKSGSHARRLVAPGAPIPQQMRVVDTSHSSLSEVHPFGGMQPQRAVAQTVQGPEVVGEHEDGTAEGIDAPPRRLLVWSEPDASTATALEAQGYRAVVVRSGDEVDRYAPARPAALFVDPLTGSITRTALQSLRRAASSAQIPVMVTAGLGEAARGAGYGADPAVLLKALAPPDSATHSPWVLLVESNADVATAFAASLERRNMQVLHATSESEAVSRAASAVPDLVVMDLTLVRRRRVGIFDWLRTHGRLHSTPIVVYTPLDLDPEELHRLRRGDTVLYLAERAGGEDVQQRLVDILGKIDKPRQ
jgi:PAS domain S-box-containing protein